jgi:hypothetical protein
MELSHAIRSADRRIRADLDIHTPLRRVFFRLSDLLFLVYRMHQRLL